MTSLPREPRRHRLNEIICVGHDEDEPCDCVERNEAAYDRECESCYDRWKDEDYND